MSTEQEQCSTRHDFEFLDTAQKPMANGTDGGNSGAENSDALDEDFVHGKQARLSLVIELMKGLTTTSPHMENSKIADAQHLTVADPSEDQEGMISGMSIISPPFTPTISTVNLAESALNNVEPLSDVQQRPSSETFAKVKKELENDLVVRCESRARIPTTSGTEMFLHVYSNNVDNKEHLAIVYGADIHSKTLFEERPGETERDRMTRGAYTGRLYPGRTSSSTNLARDVEQEIKTEKAPEADTLVRIHSECYTGETAWSARCDCGEQLDEAARLMAAEGRGCIVYLRQEGRGIGLGEKLKAYNLQDLGADTVQANLMLRHPADARSFSMATAILVDLGLTKIRLLTNNPDKIAAVEGKHGEVRVTRRVPMVPLSWQNKGGFSSIEVEKYLETKVTRMGHLLDLDGRAP